MEKELQPIIDQLLINNAQNIAQIKALEVGLIQLANATLSKQEAENFEHHYLLELEIETKNFSSRLGEILYDCKKALTAEFEALSDIRRRLDNIQNPDS